MAAFSREHRCPVFEIPQFVLTSQFFKQLAIFVGIVKYLRQDFPSLQLVSEPSHFQGAEHTILRIQGFLSGFMSIVCNVSSSFLCTSGNIFIDFEGLVWGCTNPVVARCSGSSFANQSEKQLPRAKSIHLPLERIEIARFYHYRLTSVDESKDSSLKPVPMRESMYLRMRRPRKGVGLMGARTLHLEEN
ncbi:uncharacterized protein BDV14DRAFT_182883 [Aspergillus stella-maris]|uniref:uncharacterized protein n=1 Tax=Aspergillus stella-maris TaxID=1810926 RepID=UPI003CCCD40E